MKQIRFIPVFIICAAALTLGSCNKNGKNSSENPDDIIVMTGSADVGLTDALLKGIFTGDPLKVSVAGFTYGTTEEMTEQVEGKIIGNNFSATITGLKNAQTYYYRGYAVAGGKTITGTVKSFRTPAGDMLKGKKWIELPAYNISKEQVAKAYYAEMKDKEAGRNYSILYDTELLMARWVAFPLNHNKHLGGQERTSWDYDRDGSIPTSMQPNVIGASYKDEDGGTNAWDKGHQIASGDRTGNYEMNKQTFLMTNITPQFNSLNQGAWRILEEEIQGLATTTVTAFPQDTLYVVTGPIINTAATPAYVYDGPTVTEVPRKAIRIPDGYFKVILWSKYVSPTARTYDSVGFIFENRSYSGTGFATLATSVGEVEKQTKHSFFGNLGLGKDDMDKIKSTSTWTAFTNRANNPVN